MFGPRAPFTLHHRTAEWFDGFFLGANSCECSCSTLTLAVVRRARHVFGPLAPATAQALLCMCSDKVHRYVCVCIYIYIYAREADIKKRTASKPSPEQ